MAAPSPSQQRTNASNSPSSDADATATAITVAKKPQPIPWTHEETVNLIRAYQEKWYSLKRGQLKASQWEEVAVTIAVRCRSSPFAAGFSKTGTQCRHKIEKLRKRYRAEKQRPNPTLWPYFDLMDQMERGPLPISVALPVATLNRQHDFEDDDEDYEDGDDRDDVDYGHQVTKKRRFEPRVSTDRRLDEFGHLVDGFLKNGRKLGEFEYGDPRLRFCSNPTSTNSRFQKRKAPYAAVEQEEDEEVGEEEDVGGRKMESRDMMGELAVQMREFSERFMRMERKKMEAMRETQRYRMEMENKRMQMILLAQQNTVDMISRAFASAASPSSPSSSSPSDKKFQMGNS